MAVVVCAGFCVGVDSYGAGPTETCGFSQVENVPTRRGVYFRKLVKKNRSFIGGRPLLFNIVEMIYE